MTKFHSDEYIRFLRSIRPDNMSEYNKQMQRCKHRTDSFNDEIIFPFARTFDLNNGEFQGDTLIVLNNSLTIIEIFKKLHKQDFRNT